MFAQLLPAESQRFHWYVKPVADAPLHVPFVDDNWLPVCGVPNTIGAPTAIGATVCQSGERSPGPPMVVPCVWGTGVCQLEPAPCVAAICKVAFRTSAIESVSGDHVGEDVPAATRFGVPPAAGTTLTSEPDSYAIVSPSGDHAGFVPLAIAPGEHAETVQVKIEPPFVNASFVPSGDQLGCVPAASVESDPPPAGMMWMLPPLS